MLITWVPVEYAGLLARNTSRQQCVLNTGKSWLSQVQILRSRRLSFFLSDIRRSTAARLIDCSEIVVCGEHGPPSRNIREAKVHGIQGLYVALRRL